MDFGWRRPLRCNLLPDYMIRLVLILFVALVSQANALDLTQQTMAEVRVVAKAIKSVQPYLGETKLLEYGLGIYRASQKYDIDASVLIAIAQQETAFRQNLPEGRAGEHGITQIRKMWLNQPAFKKEFKNPTIADLRRPAKSFMMSAWILKDLKDRLSEGRTLPYWCYYNANKFENRFKYFVAVNRNLAKLRRFQQTLDAKRQLADNTESVPANPVRGNVQLGSPMSLPSAGKPSRMFWTPPQPRDIARIN